MACIWVAYVVSDEHISGHVSVTYSPTFRLSPGNLHPLLNGESLKNWPNGEFENRMSQIWSIFKHLFENGPIFKHLFENGPYLAHPIFKLAIGLVFQNFII